ncbi:hypothetical protein KPH14_012644 [Odynerus spinipes]|uniref:Uncharacterized protein n=1 Tax=Odynerus spinipes TaxID=1348599 RepID=A0AAD9RFM5_9HYME|nr:hypothetical protein KPH14_012644 [Odynerus spinipes]
MSNQLKITVEQLKEALKQRGLTTSGNKAELIIRLDEADPLGEWRKAFEGNIIEALICSKLKGKPLQWFHSCPEHVQMNIDNLLRNIEDTFGQRLSRLDRRRLLEKRQWQKNEHFSDYYYDKLALANQVPVAEEEKIDYIIDGIPDENLRNQARVQNFSSPACLVEVFKKVKLSTGAKGTAEKPLVIKPGYKSPQAAASNIIGVWERAVSRCYNCNRMGHVSKDCRMPKRKKGSCFNCGGMDHAVKDCPKKPKPVNHVEEDNLEEEDEYHRNVSYSMTNGENNCKYILYSLLDTGSPISFIKQKFVPVAIRQSPNQNSQNYCGINR